MRGEIIPAQIWIEQKVGVGGRGMRRGEEWGRVRGQPGHSTNQLLERPLGEWMESFPLSPTPLLTKCR